MPVVVNEFEMIGGPEGEPAAAAPEPERAEAPPTDFDRLVERAVRRRGERARRLAAD